MFSEDDSVILNRMKNNVPSDIDTSEGSFIHDALSPSAQELAQQKINLDEVLKRAFASTACENGYSDDLGKRCSEFGITRKSGIPATGTLLFTGVDGTYIPSGTIVQSSDSGLQFKTLSDGTISNGEGSINVQALYIGTIYNLPANTINEMPTQILGVTSVTNPNPTTGGTDEETDTDLLNRYLLKMQKPSTSGNENDYINWAESVKGVGSAKVFPLWSGNGTVKIIITNSEKRAVNSTVIQNVSNFIETVRPIGVNVTVESAVELAINISVTLIIDIKQYTLTQVQTFLINNLTNYLKSIAFVSNYISYAGIGNIIFNTDGVVDYSNLKLNNAETNIALTDEQIPTLGDLTVGV